MAIGENRERTSEDIRYAVTEQEVKRGFFRRYNRRFFYIFYSINKLISFDHCAIFAKFNINLIP